jgi:hypothetical protein
MSDEHERAWLEGNRAAWAALLSECLKNLGQEDRDAHSWRLEREAAVLALRCEIRECGGDTDWPDDLHLADVISNHLAPLLDEVEWTEPDLRGDDN